MDFLGGRVVERLEEKKCTLSLMAIEDDLFIEFLGDGMQHILDKKISLIKNKNNSYM